MESYDLAIDYGYQPDIVGPRFERLESVTGKLTLREEGSGIGSTTMQLAGMPIAVRVCAYSQESWLRQLEDDDGIFRFLAFRIPLSTVMNTPLGLDYPLHLPSNAAALALIDTAMRDFAAALWRIAAFTGARFGRNAVGSFVHNEYANAYVRTGGFILPVDEARAPNARATDTLAPDVGGVMVVPHHADRWASELANPRNWTPEYYAESESERAFLRLELSPMVEARGHASQAEGLAAARALVETIRSLDNFESIAGGYPGSDESSHLECCLLHGEQSSLPVSLTYPCDVSYDAVVNVEVALPLLALVRGVQLAENLDAMLDVGVAELIHVADQLYAQRPFQMAFIHRKTVLQRASAFSAEFLLGGGVLLSPAFLKRAAFDSATVPFETLPSGLLYLPLGWGISPGLRTSKAFTSERHYIVERDEPWGEGGPET